MCPSYVVRRDIMELGYKQLDVWQKGMQLSVEIYKMTDVFPLDEKYGLIAQMRRSVVSIPSNIAEGYRRMLNKDFARFVRIAYGSGAELETQLELSRRLGFLQDKISVAEKLLNDVMSMLNKLHQSLVGVPDARRTTNTKV